MRWKGRQQSQNVEDRRGGRGSGGGRGPRRGAKVGGGVGIVTIIFIVAYVLLGGDPSNLVDTSQGGGYSTGQSTDYGSSTGPANGADEDKEFVSVVLKDTEDAWNKIFREQTNGSYREPVLVIYSDQVKSACGYSTAATGPFYCPADEKMYIDLSFYDELQTRFRAPGDFAMAYVIAHEVGHHVQNLMGTLDWAAQQKRRMSETERNKLQVRVELQADFYAGVWAYHAQEMKGILENGDLDEAINAAHAIGDDRLQRQARGYVVPESFTHGTSEQRARWFRRGWNSGKMADGDTFNARSL